MSFSSYISTSVYICVCEVCHLSDICGSGWLKQQNSPANSARLSTASFTKRRPQHLLVTASGFFYAVARHFQTRIDPGPQKNSWSEINGISMYIMMFYEHIFLLICRYLSHRFIKIHWCRKLRRSVAMSMSKCHLVSGAIRILNPTVPNQWLN